MIKPYELAITKEMLVPMQPTKQMARAMRAETPLFCRLSIDNSCYQVGIRTNKDWREVISDDQEILKEFAKAEHAMDYFHMQEFAWRWRRMLTMIRKEQFGKRYVE